MIEGLAITEDDLSGADVQALVALHLGSMHAESPPAKSMPGPWTSCASPA
jgi:putative acetyltransferase